MSCANILNRFKMAKLLFFPEKFFNARIHFESNNYNLFFLYVRNYAGLCLLISVSISHSYILLLNENPRQPFPQKASSLKLKFFFLSKINANLPNTDQIHNFWTITY